METGNRILPHVEHGNVFRTAGLSLHEALDHRAAHLAGADEPDGQWMAVVVGERHRVGAFGRAAFESGGPSEGPPSEGRAPALGPRRAARARVTVTHEIRVCARLSPRSLKTF